MIAKRINRTSGDRYRRLARYLAAADDEGEKQASQFVDKYIEAVTIDRDDPGNVQMGEIKLRNGVCGD